MEEALRALAEPRRRRILELVKDEELTAGRIAEHFEISRPAVSQHLRVLEDAGLVSVRPDGTRRLYRARPEGLEDLKEFLDGFWGSSLFRLKHVVERDERRRRRGRTDKH